nr:MAG TPA: hypothetical protein [Caudoviricetes sp.]
MQLHRCNILQSRYYYRLFLYAYGRTGVLYENI